MLRKLVTGFMPGLASWRKIMADSTVETPDRRSESRHQSKAVTISITILGKNGGGKSSIITRWVESKWTDEYNPTCEDSCTNTRTIDGQPCLLSLIDTSGQEEYLSRWDPSELITDAILLVYDVTDRKSFEALEDMSNKIDEEMQKKKDTRREVQTGLVTIVTGNKCDLEDRKVSKREGKAWAHARHYGFMETSARWNNNIEELLTLTVRRVVEAREQLQNVDPHSDDWRGALPHLEVPQQTSYETQKSRFEWYDGDDDSTLCDRWRSWRKFSCCGS